MTRADDDDTLLNTVLPYIVIFSMYQLSIHIDYRQVLLYIVWQDSEWLYQ